MKRHMKWLSEYKLKMRILRESKDEHNQYLAERNERVMT
jgi:hypothetical protein